MGIGIISNRKNKFEKIQEFKGGITTPHLHITEELLIPADSIGKGNLTASLRNQIDSNTTKADTNTSNFNSHVGSSSKTHDDLDNLIGADGWANGIVKKDNTGKVSISDLPETVLNGLKYMGEFDPTVADSITAGNVGYYYKANKAGDYDGKHYEKDDWAIDNGTSFDQVDNSEHFVLDNDVLKYGNQSFASYNNTIETDNFKTSLSIGGASNSVKSSFSICLGGSSNVIDTNNDKCSIISSDNSTIDPHASGSSILGNYNARIKKSNSLILGGFRDSITHGHTNTVIGGEGLESHDFCEVVLGNYNAVSSGDIDSWVSDDSLLTVGNGFSENNRSNALKILKNGKVGIGTSNPYEKLDVSGNIKYSGNIYHNGCTASGLSSISLGLNSTASGNYSIASGYYSVASATYSTALGNATASGIYSTALGYQTIASGDYSIVSGYNSIASGHSSTAKGISATASGDYSMSFGSSSVASGNFSAAIGYHPTSNQYCSFVTGHFNETPSDGNATSQDDNNRLFVVGNGVDNDHRSNALTVFKSGKVGIGTTSPKSLLQVNGGIQVGDDTDTASADKVGTLRYSEGANYSRVEMCVKTGSSSYAWRVINEETW